METKKAKKPLAPRVEMPCQPAEVRRSNFKEVALGYTREMAMEEASRGLQCKKPLCVSGCPVEVPIRDFIGEVARGNMDAAYRIIKSTNSLPVSFASDAHGVDDVAHGFARLASYAKTFGFREHVFFDKGRMTTLPL